MNASCHSPRNSVKSRPRSSSASSYSVPQTPLDAYSELKAGALGPDFALVKSRTCSNEEEDKTRCTAPLPSWLSETFSTLTKNHPLRLLLPSHKRNDDQNEDLQDRFAFSPPGTTLATSSLRSPITFRTRSNASQISLAPGHSSSSLHFQPYTTPGPAASIRSPTPPKSWISLAPATPDFHRHPNESNSTNNSFDSTSYAAFHYAPATLSPPPTNYRRTQPVDRPDNRAATPLVLVPDTDHAFASHSNLYTNPFANAATGPPESSEFTRLPKISCAVDVISNGPWDNIEAFSAPGPTYPPSRPANLDPPVKELSIELEPDYETLDFQWAPFNRKSTQYPAISLFSQDLLAWTVYHPRSKSTNSTSELPLATSSDRPESLQAVGKSKHELHITSLEPSFDRLSSLDACQFNPLSRTSSNIPSEKSSVRGGVHSSRLKLVSQSAGRLMSPTDSTKLDDSSLPPSSSGYVTNPEARDINVLKARSDLLSALDRIAPSPDSSKRKRVFSNQGQRSAPAPALNRFP
ncbi:hypothetical protein D9757_000548 [Collybiopsis confluens]|uniref:Uncharacterized protein n=1 Tax=Collybiopsis confluens TaxID=2823264 RepID=A0A8H5I1L9_9AGAR|nr:hypothetical protein D9757_000548 [Collybiopsis confluens]